MPLTSRILQLIAPSLTQREDPSPYRIRNTYGGDDADVPYPVFSASPSIDIPTFHPSHNPDKPTPNPALPTLILIHGGWQTPTASFSLLNPLLVSHGYTVRAPALPSCNSPSLPHPDNSFESDVAVVRKIIDEEVWQGQEVVLVMHSYGAVVGCEACKGVKVSENAKREMGGGTGVKGGDEEEDRCGVSRLIFITGMVLPVGVSCWSVVGSPKSIPGWSIGEDFCSFSDGASRFFNDYPKDLANDLASKLRPMSCQSLRSPLTHPAYKDIPSSYLVTTLDRGNPEKAQLRMIAGAGITDVDSIEAGHVPFAHPEKVGTSTEAALDEALMRRGWGARAEMVVEWAMVVMAGPEVVVVEEDQTLRF
ncbi:hypothetical protein ACLMJK_000572 [Lecanora helva]